jgi:cell division protein FtsB
VARFLAFLKGSWLALVLFAVAGVLLLSAAKGERGMERVLQLRAELDQVNDRNFRLVQQINSLKREVEMARTDDATLERLARRYLSMVRPGEVLYHVPPEKAGGAHRGKVPAGTAPASRPRD